MSLDVAAVARRTAHLDFWGSYWSSVVEEARIGVHVAVFVEPYLTYVLEGTKTTESRFSKVKCAPFEEIADGDVILIKKAGGPICGIALARKASFFDLCHEPLERIRRVHGEAICADPDFWIAKRDANFVTLIELSHQTRLDAVPFEKKDRRGWVSLGSRQGALEF